MPSLHRPWWPTRRGQFRNHGGPTAVSSASGENASVMDFPVVLLYLPSLPTGGEYDEMAANSLARNLIYVAMTRAMDNLNVFVLEETRKRAVRELAGAMNTMGVPSDAD